jgi:ketosteroid isomerase-like protein
MPEASPEEVVRQAHEAVNDGDLEAFVACWTEDCEYRPSLEGDIEGEEGVFRGHDGIRRWWQGSRRHGANGTQRCTMCAKPASGCSSS